MSDLFGTIIENGTITGTSFLIATAASLLIGLFIAFFYQLKNKCSGSFLVTLVLMPVIVQMIIMLVNGNIGAGVAVAGAFGLVRFRSAQGTGQEITSVFLAMAVGLATGMGYIGAAALFAVIVVLANYLLQSTKFGTGGKDEQVLKVLIPEDLDFEGMYDDLFAEYTVTHELTEVRTANMGSLYRLTYTVVFKKDASIKEMIDRMRERNGNLEISCGRPALPAEAL